MKKSFVFVICLAIIFLAGCQSANAVPDQSSSPASIPTTPIIPTSPPTATTTSLPVKMLSSPTPEIKPVTINAFCTLIGKDSKTYVTHGTPIIINWGWEAKTEAQINDFLENNLTIVTVDGNVIEGTRFEGIIKNERSGNPEVVWYSEVGTLDRGQHEITYDVKWKKMIDDGANTYGPGSKNETLHDDCQIIVQ